MDDRPTPAEWLLRIAYLRIATRSWPRRLEDCLAHPTIGRILVSYARRLEASGVTPDQTPPPKPPVERRAPAARAYTSRGYTGGLDRKRLAAGEREEDSTLD